MGKVVLDIDLIEYYNPNTIYVGNMPVYKITDYYSYEPTEFFIGENIEYFDDNVINVSAYDINAYSSIKLMGVYIRAIMDGEVKLICLGHFAGIEDAMEWISCPEKYSLCFKNRLQKYSVDSMDVFNLILISKYRDYGYKRFAKKPDGFFHKHKGRRIPEVFEYKKEIKLEQNKWSIYTWIKFCEFFKEELTEESKRLYENYLCEKFINQMFIAYSLKDEKKTRRISVWA